MVVDDHKFYLNRTNKSGILWVCRLRKSLGCTAKCRSNVDGSSIKFVDTNHNHGANTGIALHKALTPVSKPAHSTKTPTKPVMRPVGAGAGVKVMRPPIKVMRPPTKPTAKTPVKTPTKSAKATKSPKSASKRTSKSPKPKAAAVGHQKAVPTLVLIKHESHEENNFML